jgi:hypothetical protein
MNVRRGRVRSPSLSVSTKHLYIYWGRESNPNRVTSLFESNVDFGIGLATFSIGACSVDECFKYGGDREQAMTSSIELRASVGRQRCGTIIRACTDDFICMPVASGPSYFEPRPPPPPPCLIPDRGLIYRLRHIRDVISD